MKASGFRFRKGPCFHRSKFIDGVDPGTLFISNKGRSWSENQVTDLVETLTLRWVDKVINPHLWRDLFAHAWLQEHPREYLTLSKALWHASLQETLNTYGAEFGIANAVVATDAWYASW
jgi:site-specific recombinase XerC